MARHRFVKLLRYLRVTKKLLRTISSMFLFFFFFHESINESKEHGIIEIAHSVIVHPDYSIRTMITYLRAACLQLTST